MQVPGPFEYERATSVDHAIGLLDRLGEGARVVAGGHSLLPMMKLRIANPEYLVDINDLAPELGYVITDPTLVRIGAMARHREILESDTLAAVCPIFRDAERVIADPVVRNRGTLGGSLCQADPAEDLTTVCEVLDAVCLVRGPSGEREIAIDDFLIGPYETAVAPNEILIEVRIPVRHNMSSASQTVDRSSAGSAWHSEPPRVPRLRTTGSAITRSASRKIGHMAANVSDSRISRCRVMAPMRVRVGSVITYPSSRARSLISIRYSGLAIRSFIIGSRL